MNHFTSSPSRAAWAALALALAVPFIIPVSAQAQSSDQPAHKALPPMVVTASRLSQAQTEALPHTTVLSERQIRDSQAVDLPALLKREAGIQFTQNGGPGLASGLLVRGAETRQTLILIDGVPLTKQDTTGTVSIEHLMLDQIDRIEIVRGNVSSIYGSGAIGGVIQVFTKRGEGPAKLNAKVEAGARDTRRASAGVSGSSGGIRYSLAASNFRTDGFSAINPAQVGAANPDPDGYRNTSVSAALSGEWAKGHEMGVRFSGSDGHFDFDSSFGAPNDLHEGKTEVETMTLYSHNRLTQRWSSRLSYAQARERNANTYVSRFGTNRDEYLSKTRILQWNNELALSSFWTATAGIERQWQALDSNDGFGTTFHTARTADSMFAGLHGKTGAHQWQLNLRHDKVSRNDSASTAYLGYGFDLSETWKAIANVSTGFSAPPLGYLYAPVFGNPGLKPEHARSAEAGLQYAAGETLLRASLFTTRTRDQFLFDPVSGRFENVARASNRGLELSASGKWHDTALRASLTLQDARDVATGQRLRRRAQALGSLSADRSFGGWQLGGDLDFTGSRPDGANRLGAYWVANLKARYALSKELSLHGRIENLADRKYQTAYGFNQPRRGVFVGLSWQP